MSILIVTCIAPGERTSAGEIMLDVVRVDSQILVGPFYQSSFTGTTIPTDTFTQIAMDGASARTEVDFYESNGQTILNFGMQHVRTGGIGHHAGSNTNTNFLTDPDHITFTVSENTVYTVSGYYDSTHVNPAPNSSATELSVRLFDVTNPNDRVTLLRSEQTSSNTPNESFVVGGDGGDAVSRLEGSVSGVLIAGRQYEFNFLASIRNGVFSPSTDGGGSANGEIRLTIGTEALNSPPEGVATIFVGPMEAGTSVALPAEPIGDGCGATVTLDGSRSLDPDGNQLEYEWSVGAGILIDDPAAAVTDATFPVGVHMVTLTVYDLDADGIRLGTLDVTTVMVTVFDDTPPLVMVSADLAALWPANNKMVPVMIVVEASDACSDPGSLDVACFITSSQPDDSDGTGERVGDVDGADGFVEPVEVMLEPVEDEVGVYAALVFLRAERDGEDKMGRVYSINVGVLDGEANFGQASTTVVVPHDGRGH